MPDTVHKIDFWDGKGTHAQLHHGYIYENERSDKHDQFKIKLHTAELKESSLPNDVEGFEVYATDTQGNSYGQNTVELCHMRGRHTYIYFPQSIPAIFQPQP